MTQVMQPPDRGIISIGTPVAITAASVAAGLTIGVPYPIQVHPSAFTWVIVNNGSPYAVQVSQGQVLGQVMAFTADAFPVRAGQPLGLLGLAGAGAVVPGTDSTVYLTWSQDQPPGSYPAQVGTAGAPIGFASNLAAVNFPTSLAGSSTVSFPAAGFASTSGFGGVSVSFQCGTSPLVLMLQWSNGIERIVTVGANNTAAFTIANFGPGFSLSVFNNNAGAVNYGIQINQVVLPTTGFAPQNGVNGGLLLPTTAVSVSGSGATTTIGTGKVVYAGPATLSLVPVALNWSVQVLALTPNSGLTYTQVIYQASQGGQIPRGGGAVPITMPPSSFLVSFTNNDGIARVPACTLVADDYRISA